MEISGIQDARVNIKKECRNLHGNDGALCEAFKLIRERYNTLIIHPKNKDKTYSIRLIIEDD